MMKGMTRTTTPPLLINTHLAAMQRSSGDQTSVRATTTKTKFFFLGNFHPFPTHPTSSRIRKFAFPPSPSPPLSPLAPSINQVEGKRRAAAAAAPLKRKEQGFRGNRADMGVSAYSQDDKVIIFPPHAITIKRKKHFWDWLCFFFFFCAHMLDRPPGIHEEKEAH